MFIAQSVLKLIYGFLFSHSSSAEQFTRLVVTW